MAACQDVLCSQFFVEKPDSCPIQEACGVFSPPEKGVVLDRAHDKGSIGTEGMQQQQQQQQTTARPA
eukprot:6258638-Prorocentrum_lima.AAC.1